MYLCASGESGLRGTSGVDRLGRGSGEFPLAMAEEPLLDTGTSERRDAAEGLETLELGLETIEPCLETVEPGLETFELGLETFELGLETFELVVDAFDDFLLWPGPTDCFESSYGSGTMTQPEPVSTWIRFAGRE